MVKKWSILLLKLLPTSRANDGIWRVLLFILQKALSLKLKINLAGSDVNEQMRTHNMNAHRGGLEEQGRFLPAPRGPSLQQRVGAGRHGRVGMWTKQHGGKILGLLASVRFLLISHLVVPHVVHLTTILGSASSAGWLSAEVSATWQREQVFIRGIFTCCVLLISPNWIYGCSISIHTSCCFESCLVQS